MLAEGLGESVLPIAFRERCRYSSRMMEGPTFEWDDRKAAENVARGRPPFEDVLRFDFNLAMIVDDERWDYGERRFQAIGLIDGRHHFVVYTEREDRRRIISFRKANQKEVRLYDRHTQIAIPRPST